MTAPGFHRHDAKGRSTDRLKPHNMGKLEGPFVAHTRELLASPAWGALTLVDRRVLDRLEIEHMAHGGTENGNLICTYTNFEEYGIRRASVPAALGRLEALGFVEIVERGWITRGEFKCPSIYRLTYVTGNIAATDEWKRISTAADAERVAKAASLRRKQDAERREENKKPGAKALPHPGTKVLPLRS